MLKTDFLNLVRISDHYLLCGLQHNVIADMTLNQQHWGGKNLNLYFNEDAYLPASIESNDCTGLSSERKTVLPRTKVYQPFHTNFNTVCKRIYFSSQPKIKLTGYQETLIMKITAQFDMSITERKDLEPLQVKKLRYQLRYQLSLLKIKVVEMQCHTKQLSHCNTPK